MNERYFTNRIFYRFFYPAIISSVCLGLANLADALCVGIMMGEPALAAIGLISPIYMVFNVLDVGLAVGGAIVFTQLMGGGRVKQAVNVFYQMLLATILVSVVVAVAGTVFLPEILLVLGTAPAQGIVYQFTWDYAWWLLLTTPLFFLNQLFYHFIRCDDGEKRASIGLVVSNLLDVGLSFILVLGFDMGIKGAVWATILGTAAGVLIYLPHFFVKSNILSLRLTKPDFPLMMSCYRTGFSSSSQYLAQFVVLLVLNNLLMRLHGEGALAVFNVVINVSYVLIGLYSGVAATLQPLAATFYGERNAAAQRQSLRLAILWGVALGVVCTGAVAIWAPQVAAVFGLSESMLDMGALALRCYCLGGLLIGPSIILSSYWQAVGRERETLTLTLLRSLLVYLVLAVPLAFGPLALFWWVFPATEALSLLVFLIWQQLGGRGQGSSDFAQLEQPPILTRLLRQDGQELGQLLDEVEIFCSDLGATAGQTYLANMAVEEMCEVIFRHSTQHSPRDIFMQITLFPIGNGLFELHIRDNAPVFDPFSLRMSRINEAEDQDSAMESMGVLMVKKKAKDFYYRHYQGFNTLTVRI